MCTDSVLPLLLFNAQDNSRKWDIDHKNGKVLSMCTESCLMVSCYFSKWGRGDAVAVNSQP